MTCPSSAPLHVIHAHSVNSVLDGAGSVDEYIAHVKDNGLNFLSLTEHGYNIGWYELVTKCEKANVKPCCACEIYLMPREDTVFIGKPFKLYHLTLLAQNEIGFANLRRISNLSWGPGRVTTAYGHSKPRATFEDLEIYNEGIICGAGCIEGPVAKHVIRNEPDEAKKNMALLKAIFKDRLFIEVMPNVVNQDFEEEVIEVENICGKKYILGVSDTVMTSKGRVTIVEAMKQNITEISDPLPLRSKSEEFSDEQESKIRHTPEVDCIRPPEVTMSDYQTVCPENEHEN